MNDLTLLYYTANRLTPHFAGAVRRSIADATTQPIVVVAQNTSPHDELNISADFTNRIQTMISMGRIEPSIAQVYFNVLLAAKKARTAYVAFVEDDCLYVPEHFDYRPALDTFSYNENRWLLSRRLSDDGRSRVGHFFFNPRTQLAMGICSRELLIDTLDERFAKHSDPPRDTTVAKKSGWGEPGRYERNLGLTPRKLERFKWTDRPCISINHGQPCLMGRRQWREDMPSVTDLEPWGNATALWERIVG